MGAWDDSLIANDVGAVANALSVVNKVNDSEGAESRREETYARQNTERNDTQTALGAMQMGEEVPADLTPSSVNAGKVAYANERRAETIISGLDMNDEVLAKKNEIFGKMALYDGRAGDFLKQVVPETSTDMQALLGARRDVNENNKLKYENMQQLKKTAALQYQDHQSKMTLASQYLEQGNTMLAEKALFSAVNEAPHPVYMEKNPQGNYDLYYEEVGQEKTILSQGANVTAQQAIKLIKSIPPEQAQAVFAMDMAKAQDFNSKVRPETWGKGKDKVDVFNMMDPMNPNQPQTLVFEHNGGRLDGMTVDMLRNQGYRPEASLADQYKTAQINNVGNKGGGNSSKQLEQDKKNLSHLLSPWEKDITGLSPIQAAQAFIGEHDGQKDISPENQKLLGQAKQAIAINDSINQKIGGGPVPEPEADPFVGAQDAFKTGGSEGLSKFLSGIKDPAARKSVVDQMRKQAEAQDNAGPAGGAMDLTDPAETEVTNETAEPGAMDIADDSTQEDVGTDWDERLAPGKDVAKSAWNAINDNPLTRALDNKFGKAPTSMAKNQPADSKKAVAGKKDYGKRADGTPKGSGFFGELPGPDGSVSTEVSIGIEIDGKEVEIPTLVPTLSQEEINAVLKGGQIPDSVIQKAIAHAKMRMSQGKSPFAGEDEQVNKVATK